MRRCAGADAELFEIAALVAAPGAKAQRLHADQPFEAGGFLTSFVALQRVPSDMGPTVSLRGAHTERDQDAFLDGRLAKPLTQAHTEERSLAFAACGLLETGDANLYDGCVLHGSSANICAGTSGTYVGAGDATGQDEDMRVPFHTTFRRADAPVEYHPRKGAHALMGRYRGGFTLGGLRRFVSY